jgi:hypothetical protein
MKPSLPIIAVSVVFVSTIAVLGVAIERQRAPASPDFTGPPVAVKAGATTLCVGRQFVDPDALRALQDGAAPGRIDLAAFSADLTGLTPQRYAAGAYQSSPDWVRITLWPQDPPATGIDLEPACGAARCSMRTRAQADGLRFDYSFPATMKADWQKLHANLLKRVDEWAKDASCRR